MHEIDTATKAAWAVLGGTGGAAKVLVQLLGTSPLPKWQTVSWLMFANIFVSGFAGFLGAIIATQFTVNENLHVVAAGVSGYMGVAALDLFSLWLKRKVVPK